MKKFIVLFALIIGTTGAWANTSTDGTKTMKVDLSESTLFWQGYKVTGDHHGFVDIKSGQLQFDEDGMLTGGNFVIDMTSIVSTDLSGDSKGKLEGHLKSDDFFSVQSYPEAHLDIKRVISRGMPGDYRIVADLTVKGNTEEIRFNTKLEDKGNMKVGSAEFKLDRTKFDVRYGSGTFFSNLGDNTIYDEFDIKVNIVAK